MDLFYEYWEILPGKEESNNFGTEYVKYIRNINEDENELPEDAIQFLEQSLTANPYPTWQIVKSLFSKKDESKNKYLEEVCINSLNKMVNQINKHPNSSKLVINKLYCLISYIDLSDESMEQIKIHILPKLVDLKEEKKLLSSDFYLALLSRNSHNLLNQYFECEREQTIESFQLKSLLLQVFQNKTHWFLTMLNTDAVNIKKYLSNHLCQHINLFKMITFSGHCVSVDSWLNFINICSSEIEIDSEVIRNDVLKMFLLEIKRRQFVLNFLKKNSNYEIIDENALAKKNVMTHLLDYVNFHAGNYDSIKHILLQNQELTEKQLEIYNIGHENNHIKSESQLMNEYLIIKLYLDLILMTNEDNVNEELVEASLSRIRTLYRSFDRAEKLYELIEKSFLLLFIRYEHVRKTKFQSNDSNKTLNSPTISNLSQTNTEISDGETLKEFKLQSGFICSKKSIELILNSMSSFLMSNMHTDLFKNTNEDLKQKFKQLLNTVENTMWRLKIVTKCIDNKNEEDSMNFFKLNTLLKVHKVNNDPITSNSSEKYSDDDKKVPKKIMMRRRKKRPKSKVSEDNDDESDSPSEYCNTSDTTAASIETLNINVDSFIETHKKSKSIIPSLLMSPENLIRTCLIKNDNRNIDKLIKKYNLIDSLVAREIKYTRNFQLVRLQLISVVYEYNDTMMKELETSTSSGKFEIGMIKSIAVAGFETAKILNLIEKFIDTNHLNQEKKDTETLEKSIALYPNLKYYTSGLINVLPVIDLLLSLPCSFDLNQNIYKLIMKHWELNKLEQIETQVDINFGYVQFLKNLMSTLTVYKNQNEEITIQNILNDEIFSLDTEVFTKKQENLKNANELMILEVDSLNNESELLKTLQQFDKFDAEINYMNRVNYYVKNLKLLLKFYTNQSYTFDELLKLNIEEIVGEIICTLNVDPENFENFAFNVNINLVYAISCCVAEEIFQPLPAPDEEKLVFLFLQSEKGEKSFLLEEGVIEAVITKPKIFKISTTTILYYIKRHNFLLAYILKEIQNFEYKTLKYDEMNLFDNIKKLKAVKVFKEIYHNNLMLAALNYDNVNLKMVLEKIKETVDLEKKVQILSSINVKQYKRHKSLFDDLKDFYIEKMMLGDGESGHEKNQKYHFLEMISDPNRYAELLIKCVGYIENDVYAERLLQNGLLLNNIDEMDMELKRKLEEWLEKLLIYRKITELFQGPNSTIVTDVNWLRVMLLSTENPATIVNYLVNRKNALELCISLIKIHPLKEKNDEITWIFIEALNNPLLNESHLLLFKIIESLPKKLLIELYDFSLNYVKNLPAINYIVCFLEKCKVPFVDRAKYQKFKISLRAFHILPQSEYQQLWRIVSKPLLIIEQYLMNSKIEMLAKIIKEMRLMLKEGITCKICNNNMFTNVRVEECLVYDIDSNHDEVLITRDCIDLLLKLYAAKALDFQILEINSASSLAHGRIEVSSIDSASGIFQMPKQVPNKDQWVKDEDVSSCMCCKRTKFSLLTRRHHCRRCARVVCSNCSQNKTMIPDVYGELMVRVCDDCEMQMKVKLNKTNEESAEKARTISENNDWHLNGDVDDNIVRDEFSFEYSPNVGLCIAICDLHSNNADLAKFLLFHCHRMELLLRPIQGKLNPEIDYILVATMLKTLAFSAKLRGESSECNSIIDHSDIILSVLKNRCENLLPTEPINTNSLRKLRDALVVAEKWNMAIDISLKCGFKTTGVFAAWGVSSLKAGCFETAREKFTHCLTKVTGSNNMTNTRLINLIEEGTKWDETEAADIRSIFRRVKKSPAVIVEILNILDSTTKSQQQPETLQRASTIISSSSSLNRSSRINLHEPALNIMNTLTNLKNISRGEYGEGIREKELINPRRSSVRRISEDFHHHAPKKSNVLTSDRYFEECSFYLFTYCGHIDILKFLEKNNLLTSALKYIQVHKIETELFIQYLFTPKLKVGQLENLIKCMREVDESLFMWNDYIIQTCRYLEKSKWFNCLYHLQILTKDIIRASMTCVKFYTMKCYTFSELNSNSIHLLKALTHLQSELENCNYGEKEPVISGSDEMMKRNSDRNQLILKYDQKTINSHINTINRQMEVAKYLAACENSGKQTLSLLPKIFRDYSSNQPPTLFGGVTEATQLAVLLIVCGNIESGFGISYRIIQDFHPLLKSRKVYIVAAKFLSSNKLNQKHQIDEIDNLVECIKTNCISREQLDDIESFCDELICSSIEISHDKFGADVKNSIDKLIRKITNNHIKIQCFINSNQLKSAYLLSVKINSLNDIVKIHKHALATQQLAIINLCSRKLQEATADGTSMQSDN
ncbi:unnamed protein product [Diamesa serratosioi]